MYPHTNCTYRVDSAIFQELGNCKTDFQVRNYTCLSIIGLYLYKRVFYTFILAASYNTHTQCRVIFFSYLDLILSRQSLEIYLSCTAAFFRCRRFIMRNEKLRLLHVWTGMRCRLFKLHDLYVM